MASSFALNNMLDSIIGNEDLALNDCNKQEIKIVKSIFIFFNTIYKI